jgi:hypothetical protein
MLTWLDTQPPSIVRCALADRNEVDQSARFALWLVLVDLHLDQLHTGRHGLQWDWHLAYDSGWSPRTAALAAWADNLRSVFLAGAGS